MEIKILGTGCPKCQALKKAAQEVVEKLGIEAKIIEVKEIEKIMQYPIMFTPALVVNEEVKFYGKVPPVDEIVRILEEEASR
jgi:small redox-active disulfide protein 2